MQARADPDRGVALPVLLANALVAAVLWALTLGAFVGLGRGGAVVGVLLALLALPVSLAVVGNVLMRRWPRGLPAPRLGQRDGEPAVVVRAWTPSGLLTPVVTAGVGLSGTVLGLGGVLAGTPLLVLALPAGLWLLWLTGLMVVGRIPLRHGAWLTPTRLVVVQEMSVAELAWDDVDGARVHGHHASVFGTRPPRGHRVSWSGRRRPIDLPVMTVASPRTGVPATGLVGLVERYAAHPSARAELAGPDGLATVTRAVYTTQGGTADPPLHPARQPR